MTEASGQQPPRSASILRRIGIGRGPNPVSPAQPLEPTAPEIHPEPQSVIEILQQVEPTRQDALAMAEQKRGKMRETISAIEEARDRIGNFCIAVGSGDTRYVVLAYPEVTPVESGGTITSYLAFAQEGTREINIFEGLNQDAKGAESNRAIAAAFRNSIEEGRKTGNLNLLDGPAYTEEKRGNNTRMVIRYADGPNGWFAGEADHNGNAIRRVSSFASGPREYVEPITDEEHVLRYLKTSIEKAQEPDRARIASDKATIHTADVAIDTVREEIDK